MEFETWFEELLEAALEKEPLYVQYIKRAPFMYEDYFESGMTPRQAYEAEWGE